MVHVHQVRKNTPNQTENKFEESARERVSDTEKVVLVVDWYTTGKAQGTKEKKDSRRETQQRKKWRGVSGGGEKD